MRYDNGIEECAIKIALFCNGKFNFSSSEEQWLSIKMFAVIKNIPMSVLVMLDKTGKTLRSFASNLCM